MFDYEAKLPHWINRAGFLIRAEAQKEMASAGHDLTAEEWALLMVLWRDGAQSMNALASVTLRDRTTVTRLVDRLVAKGLLKRRADSGDRRKVVVDLTDASREMEAPVTGAIGKVVEKALASIDPDEVATAISVLRRIVANFDGAEQEGETGRGESRT